MPGIAGLVGRSADTTALPPMIERLRHQPWYTRDAWADEAGGVALGRAGLGYVNIAPQPAVSEDGTRRVVLEGELYDDAALRRELEGKGHAFRSHGHAELFLHGWEEEGAAFARRVNGCFAAAVWDAAADTLTLVNDRFGMRALYYAHTTGRLAFGSEIKALLADPALSRATDLQGLAQFFTFGHCFGETTSFAAIRLLPAAGVLTYHAATDRAELTRYARLGESWEAGAAGPVTALGRIDEALARSVARCTSGTANLGLSLSGGLDSRTLLGLIDPAQPVLTVCLGMDGSIDVRLAAELARLTNRRHHSHNLGADFLGQFDRHLRDMVHLTDGQCLSQCLGLPTLPLYRDLGIEVLVRGHAGELMHMTKAYSFSLDAEALKLTGDGLEGWLWRRLQTHMLDGVDAPLLHPDLGTAMVEPARESLREGLRESAGMTPPAHRIWHLFVAQRIRRKIGLSLTELGSVVEIRLPYLDTGLIDALMAAPPELKLGETIQTYILRKRQPRFLQVANANTGARIGAAPAARALAKLKLQVLAKLRVRGYQPYERLGLWLRRELRPTVEAVLLADRSLSRGVLNPEAVRAAVANHFNGRRNHTFLLMAMMIFELGQRELVDGEISW